MVMKPRGERTAIVICGAAFVLRVLAAAIWPGHFWSYSVYYDFANTLAHGGGYCLGANGTLCAYFPPVYPTILAACILTGHAQAAIVAVSSLMGVGTVWLTWRIGQRLFGETAGLVAASYAAVYPYFVWHDAVVQENAALALIVAAAMLLLIRVNQSKLPWFALGAGAMLGLAVLTKANLLLLVPMALLWMAIATHSAKRVALTALGVTLVVGPWLVRTWRITGSPLIYSNGGFALWTSNHRLTFDYFPERSIDDAPPAEERDFSPEEQAELARLNQSSVDPHGIQTSRFFWNRGIAYIETHPWQTLGRGVEKVWVAFSPVFSPRKSWAFEAVYFVSYFPLLLLSGVGAWRGRKRWRDLGYIYAALLAFAMGSAVFWAHTSHRMYLEPYLMILSAGALMGQSLRASRPVWENAAAGKGR